VIYPIVVEYVVTLTDNEHLADLVLPGMSFGSVTPPKEESPSSTEPSQLLAASPSI
jgi:hypothetical protein